ncbi:kelch-like protein 12 isoform X2 [Sceloporus undulatus]|uniref:kelch-like protein 12 isoform X2 n=1 Tax=Sceloporus undulatus TaxID=8520 RepID=UPI001C4C5436|nr:kelch-like protein 12 isoform X2 [Sceloporus undulatus]
MERYDPNIDQWIVLENMETVQKGAGLVAANNVIYCLEVGVAFLNDHIYAVGGYDGTECLSSVEAYNIRTDSWTTVTSMTTPRCHVGVTVLKGRLYAIAGYGGESHLSSIECYDPIIDSWEVVTSLETQRREPGVCVLREN